MASREGLTGQGGMFRYLDAKEPLLEPILSKKCFVRLTTRTYGVTAIFAFRQQARTDKGDKQYAGNHYQQLLAICDYISGMTDSYAVSLYKKLTGISLPVN